MFSKEQRLRAVKLLIKYDMSYSQTITELGYPCRMALREWYSEYIKNGDLHERFNKKHKYSQQQKEDAVNYYLEHGKCIARTIRKLGYPSKPMLIAWIDEFEWAIT